VRYVNGFFCILFVLFAIVQYNDPDAIVWILIYGITAAWAGFAAFRPTHFAHSQPLRMVFGVSLLVLVAIVIYDWPPSIADWYENELVREGFGLIIATVALLVVAYSLWRIRHEGPVAGQRG
jgi:hypothetical protein